VVIGRGRARIGHAVLSVHGVMVVFTVSGGLIVTARDGGTVRAAGCNGGGQLQPGALPPGGRAGDQRKRDGQDQEMAQNMTHAAMLTGRAGSRQGLLRDAAWLPMVYVGVLAFSGDIVLRKSNRTGTSISVKYRPEM
jgi:hypothetical protein